MGRLSFGPLCALNAETLAPGRGIPLHAHENMEIVSVALRGTLRHRDSRGATHVIPAGDVHVLSAGLGVTHWEHNDSADAPAHYVQAWIRPKSRMTPTRYAQGTSDDCTGRFCLLAAPAGYDAVVGIDQDAFVSLARLERGAEIHYSKYCATNGLHVFVIGGRVTLGAETLVEGTGRCLHGEASPALLALTPARVLCIEVPL